MAKLSKRAIDTLPSERPLYFLCHAGGVSPVVAAALEKNGLKGDVKVVAGGVDRWVFEQVPCEVSDDLKQRYEQASVAALREGPANIQEINE